VRIREAFIICSLGVLSAAVAGSASAEHPRERLFAAQSEHSLSAVLGSGARLIVIYTPNIEECMPQEIYVTAALERLAREVPAAKIVTLVPVGVHSSVIDRGIFGVPFPGSLMKISRRQWREADQVAPRPRIEVWSGDGRLLLMRSIPSAVSLEEIYHEMLWTLAFTEPPEEAE
jgi:hypothetical protein